MSQINAWEGEMAKVEEIITEHIIKKLEEGTVPWHKPWNGGDDAPKNLVSKKEYHGINAFLTACSSYASPYWLSYKQCTGLGGTVKKGEKGTPVIYWNWQEVKKDGSDDIEKKVPFMRYYTVFNLEQCECIPAEKIPTKAETNEIPLEPIAACEEIINHMPTKPEIKHGKAAAFYSPTLDYVNMPRMDTFDGQCEYYSTLFHELTHSTGHKDRLGRKCIDDCGGWSSFGSTPYAKEELVAEMGAAFLCGHVGIENTTIDNSAAYIASWLKRLRNDSKLVIVAAGQAQKASDYILGKKHGE
jgi:antirestriction protein ArdC